MAPEVQSMTVSAIIPVFNGEKFIARAIESVLAQDYPHIEIIVIDDGSEDGTSAILQSFGEKIRSVRIKNAGVSNARNTGINISNGELIAFLDADDVWFKEKISKQVSIFKNHPDIGFSCCDYASSGNNEKEIKSHFEYLSSKYKLPYDRPVFLDALKILIRVNFFGTCSNVIVRKRNILLSGNFDTAYKQAEDYDLWIKLLFQTGLFIQSDILLEKIAHEGNLTNRFYETLLFHEKVLVKLRSRIIDDEDFTSFIEIIDESLTELRFEIVNNLYNAGYKIRAFMYIWKAFSTLPNKINLLISIKIFMKKFVRFISNDMISRKNFIKL